MPSSTPYQFSPKNMCPEISPPSRMPSSRILRLRSECPVFHMMGWPAVAPDVVHQHLRGLDVEDDLGPRMADQQVAGQEREQQVRLVPPALLVDDADAVRVAVVGEPHVGADLGDLGHQVAHVLLHLRIRQVVGEAAVGLAVELDHLAAEPAQELGGEDARDAVARVDHHLEPAREAHVAGDRAQVLFAGVAGGRAPAAPLEVAGADAGEETLDLVLGERRRARVHHLDPVVGDRVVAAGDGGAAVEPPVGGREVEQRGVVDADVDHVDSGGEHSGPEGGLQLGGRDAIVHAEGHGAAAPPAHQGSVGASHLLEDRRCDVACPPFRARHRRGRCTGSACPRRGRG